jgi:hypothetical protein
MYKAEIFHMIDLENSSLSHKSISGGRATHSFNQIETITSITLESLKTKITDNYGLPYDAQDNSLYLGISESEWSELECPENYEAIITLVNEEPVSL